MDAQKLYEELDSIDPQERRGLRVQVVVYLNDRAAVALPLSRVSGPGISGPFNIIAEEPPPGVPWK